MDRRRFLSVSAVGAGWLALPARGQQPAVNDVSAAIEAIRKEFGLPGMAAAAVRTSGTVAEGVTGVRQVGQDAKITPDDRFGMASCTKVMTATMVLRLIDKGRLSFETTLAEALPGVAMRDDYRKVTLAQLLLFKGGIHPYTLFGDRQATPILFELDGSGRELREKFVRHVLQEEPIARPGTERIYSNASYALAGFVAEQRTGKSWETLMQEEVFEPLKMTHAAFGRPRSKNRPDEPAMHRREGDAYVPEADQELNTAKAMAPAGDVCCSIRDFAKFAAYELGTMQGKDALLGPATRERWQELSRTAGPLVRDQKTAKAKGPEAKGPAAKGPKGKAGKLRQPGAGKIVTRGPQSSDERSFFGGSAYISTGCILWSNTNLGIVVAINAGGAGEAVRAAFDALKQEIRG